MIVSEGRNTLSLVHMVTLTLWYLGSIYKAAVHIFGLQDKPQYRKKTPKDTGRRMLSQNPNSLLSCCDCANHSTSTPSNRENAEPKSYYFSSCKRADGERKENQTTAGTVSRTRNVELTKNKVVVDFGSLHSMDTHYSCPSC